MVRNHYRPYLADRRGFDHLRTHTYELCEFLHDVLHLTRVEGRFPRKVGLHRSCHAQRELQLASSSERMVPPFDKVKTLLSGLSGITLLEPARTDECCGFGGTFAVAEEAVSCQMGRDRIAEHEKNGVEVIAGVDMSCLMHLDGLLRREKRPLQVRHVAELLAGEG
jgi:L-lactate dehydrogenase complex protein LldE